MVNIMKKKLPHLLILFGILSLNSCVLYDFITGTEPAQIECDDKRLFVVPFNVNTEHENFRYFDSKMGRSISDGISRAIIKNERSAKVAIANDEIKTAANNPFDTPKWAEICTKHNLDFIVFGTITQFQTKDPRDVAVSNGKMSAKMSVIDKDNNVIMQEEEFSVIYPEGRGKDPKYHIGAVDIELSNEQITTRLINKLAIKLSRIFYSYKIEE